MTYAYLRATSDPVSLARQREAIRQYCQRNAIGIDEWIEEPFNPHHRGHKQALGMLLQQLQKRDTLFSCEITDFSDSIHSFLDMLGQCLQKEVRINTILDGYQLDNAFQTRSLQNIFSFVSGLTRQFSVRCTKDGLAESRAKGKTLGRRKGYSPNSANQRTLDSAEQIREMLAAGSTREEVAKAIGVSIVTLYNFLREHPELKPESKRKSVAVKEVKKAPGRNTLIRQKLDSNQEYIREQLAKGVYLKDLEAELGVNYFNLYHYLLQHPELKHADGRSVKHYPTLDALEDKKDLIRERLAARVGLYKIAAELGIATLTLRNFLDRHPELMPVDAPRENRPRGAKPTLTNDQVEPIRLQLLAGMKQREIAESLNVSPMVIQRFIRKHQVLQDALLLRRAMKK